MYRPILKTSPVPLLILAGLLATALASFQVVQVKTEIDEKPLRGGWDHKLTCQKSFSGKLSAEMRAAVAVCRDRHPVDQVCNYHCISNLLDMISIKKRTFNKRFVSSVLSDHLTKKGGGADKSRLKKQLYSCEKHLPLLAKPCAEQSALWDCVDSALVKQIDLNLLLHICELGFLKVGRDMRINEDSSTCMRADNVTTNRIPKYSTHGRK